MKKIYKIIIIYLGFTISTFGQTLLVKYCENSIISEERLKELPEEIRNERMKKKKYNLFVDVNKGLSYYVNDVYTKNSSYNTEYEKETQYDDHVEIITTKVIVDLKNTEKFYYKDFGKDEMLFEFFNGDQLFTGKDSLKNWNWQLTNETKIIYGYTCKKATAVWGRGEYVAWFTEDIPVQAGPEKFDGLPGLILYVGTPYYEYSAVLVKEMKDKVNIEKPNFDKIKTYTLEEINDIIKQKIKGLQSSSITTQDGDKTITRETIIYKN
ncbi:GLPGLI family protein [Flavobacterium haoranii]|uniref:GLPGLI family protein n=1 Tax=Flavobacterium haoranii TaxID=683124 RepID=UPI000934BE25|nr:GLPGLI family protein [Flavobacterium haoranii]